MRSILLFLEGIDSGDDWEELCVSCYRMRYQDDHYREIPATYKGDAGIEGYTQSGIVHQCYFPEREYTDDALYEHLRDKLTDDINKLINNAQKLANIGVPPVTEWHFVIPEYKDSRILVHATKKQSEILEAKITTPARYKHIADDFKIHVKIADDFKKEISWTLRTNIMNNKLNITVQHINEIDWTKCDSEKVTTIRRKIKAVMPSDAPLDSIEEVVKMYVQFYLRGIETMNNWRVNFPDIHENVFRLEQSYQQEVRIKTLMNTTPTMNKTIFEEILNEFGSKLSQDFSYLFTIANIGNLKQDMVASWLADCPMEFRSA